MNNICFVGNFFKTPVYERIADTLIERNVNVFWISANDNEYIHLKSKYSVNNVLLLNRNIIKEDNHSIDDFKINEILFIDRVFKYDKINGEKYLINCQKHIYNFIKENNICFVFGENTTSLEILILRICKKRVELNCKYYSHGVTRIPNGRIVFFENEEQNKILPIEDISNSNIEKKCNEVNFKVDKPNYLKINDKILAKKMSFKGLLLRFKNLIIGENILKTNPFNIPNGFYRFYVPTREVFNQLTYKLVKKHSYSYIESKKYIFFGFHKQPESSVDVCGRYYENQFQNVLNLWRQLPPDWLLVIKEHSNAIGDRSLFFYNKLLRYSNIVLINEKEDSHNIIKGAQLVATNTGTMALEAALLGVPSITFSKVFFNMHNYCFHCDWTTLKSYSSIIDLINSIKVKEDNTNEYTDFIISNSYKAELTDIKSNPNVMRNDNIQTLSSVIFNITQSN